MPFPTLEELGIPEAEALGIAAKRHFPTGWTLMALAHWRRNAGLSPEACLAKLRAYDG